MSFWSALGSVSGSLLGLGGSIAGGVISADAAKEAAQVQADASKYAANLQQQEADKALAFQQQTYADTRNDTAAGRAAGLDAINRLEFITNPANGATGGTIYNQYDNGTPFSYSGADVTSDPGYQFRMDQGQQAIERSAAARGQSMSGGTLKALTQYGQDYASNEYQNAYNRALTGYNVNKSAFDQQKQLNLNTLQSIAGLGQTSIGTNANAGANFANNSANITTNAGTNIGNLLTSGAAATAAGTVGSANAIGSSIQNSTNALQQQLLLRQLINGNTNSGSSYYGNT